MHHLLSDRLKCLEAQKGPSVSDCLLFCQFVSGIVKISKIICLFTGVYFDNVSHCRMKRNHFYLFGCDFKVGI